MSIAGKRTILLLLALWVVIPLQGWAATPTVVQHFGSPTNLLAYTTGTIKVGLENKTLAGNGLILAVQNGNPSPAYTPTDNSGVAWPAVSVTCTGAGQVIKIWVKPNISADITTITLTPGGGTMQFTSVVVSEFNNLATSSPVDVTFCNTAAAAPNVSTGSNTTTVDGDLVWIFGADQVSADALNLGTYTVGSGATKIRGDRGQGSYAQWQVQATQGAINPGYTESGTNSTVVAGVAVKQGTAGAALPAGMRIVNLQAFSIAPGAGTSYSFDFPNVGNLIALSYVGELGGTTSAELTGITSSPSATWQQRGSNWGTVSDFAIGQYWTTENASASTTRTGTLTPAHTYAGKAYHSLAVFYDIVGAAIAPYDTFAGTSGTQSVTADLTTMSITPTTSNGLVLGEVWIDSHTISGVVTPSGGLFDAVYATASDGNDDNWAETNGVGHYYNHDTSAESWVWSVVNNVTPAGVGTWAAGAIAFKAPTAACGYLLSGTGGAIVTEVGTNLVLEGGACEAFPLVPRHRRR